MSSTAYAELAKRSGYDEVVADQDVMMSLLLQIVRRAMEPVQMVVDSCGPKRTTITDQHFRLMARLAPVLCSHHNHGKTNKAAVAKGGGLSTPQKKEQNERKAAKARANKAAMKGGSTTLPLQYFGVDDYGNNYSADAGDMGHAPWSDPNLTRTGLSASDEFGPSVSPGCAADMMSGGAAATASSAITDSTMSAILREYNVKLSGERVRLTDSAKQLLKRIVFASAVDMLRAERPSGVNKKRLDNGKVKAAMHKVRVNFAAAV